MMKRIADLLRNAWPDERVKNSRLGERSGEPKDSAFAEVNDGSSLANLQVAPIQIYSNYLEVVRQPEYRHIGGAAGTGAFAWARGQRIELRELNLPPSGVAVTQKPTRCKRNATFERWALAIAHQQSWGCLSGSQCLCQRNSPVLSKSGGSCDSYLVITAATRRGWELFTVTSLDLEAFPNPRSAGVD